MSSFFFLSFSLSKLLFLACPGRMAVHSGKRGEADDQTGWRLYFVRGEKDEEAHLLQVRRCVQALRSRGSLLLINQSTGTIFLWHGAKSLKHTRQVASSAAAALKLNRPPELNLRVRFGFFLNPSSNSCFFRLGTKGSSVIYISFLPTG